MNQLSATHLVITGSARKDSRTKGVAAAVLNGMAYHEIHLAECTIMPYNYEGLYSNDDFAAIVAQMLTHKTIIFATPVYWYAMSGVMKTFIDRFTDLVTLQKTTGRKLKGKNFLLMASGSDGEMPQGFEIPFQLTVRYFDANYCGAVYVSTKQEYPDRHPEAVINFREKVASL